MIIKSEKYALILWDIASWKYVFIHNNIYFIVKYRVHYIGVHCSGKLQKRWNWANSSSVILLYTISSAIMKSSILIKKIELKLNLPFQPYMHLDGITKIMNNFDSNTKSLEERDLQVDMSRYLCNCNTNHQQLIMRILTHISCLHFSSVLQIVVLSFLK